MQNISLSKKIQPEQENYKEAKQELHEKLISKIIEQHLGRKFKEEDFKDCHQVFGTTITSWYHLFYKTEMIGKVTEKQTENSLTINFTQPSNY